MILYYTGANNPGDIQINADLSLGGFVSSTPVPNSRVNNIFSTISKNDVLNSRSRIRMIALQNTTGVDVANVTINTNISGSHCKLKIAAVSPFINANNQSTFESVVDAYSLPYQAVLDYHEADNKITIDTIPANGVIGIWILQEIDKSSFPEFNIDDSLTGQQIADILQAVVNPLNESIQLVIEWT